jgi:hypothetical protein
MRNTFRLGLTAGAAVVALATAGIAPAQAFSIGSGGAPGGIPEQFSLVGGVTTVDFNSSATLPINYTPSLLGSSSVESTSVPGSFAAPFNDTTRYLAVGTGPAPIGGTSVNIALSGLQNYFGLYWGSIDSYNTVEFYRGSFALADRVGSYTGAQVLTALGVVVPLGTNNQTSLLTNRYINFDSEGASQYFDRIRLTSTQAAFESDNHAFRAVPTPALLPGLVGIGVSLWRKRRQQAA